MCEKFCIAFLLVFFVSAAALPADSFSGPTIGSPQPLPKQSGISVKTWTTLSGKIDQALEIMESSDADFQKLLADMATSEKRYQAILHVLTSKVNQSQIVIDRQSISLGKSAITLSESDANLKNLESRYLRDNILWGATGIGAGIVLWEIVKAVWDYFFGD